MRCQTKGCSGVPTKAGHSPWCSRCKTRRYKEGHPLRYSFHKLKMRALERGKVFELTFAEYHAFAVKTDYHRLKGKSGLSLSVDRIENVFGYVAWNIRALTVAENSRKEFVPYFQQQGMTRSERDDLNEQDAKRSAELLALADGIAVEFVRGSDAFWAEYFRRKKILTGLGETPH